MNPARSLWVKQWQLNTTAGLEIMDISTKIQQPAGNFSNMWTEKTSLTYRMNIKIFLNGLQATSTLTHTYMSVLNLCESQKRSCEPDIPTKKSLDALCFLTLDTCPNLPAPNPHITAKQDVPHLQGRCPYHPSWRAGCRHKSCTMIHWSSRGILQLKE